MTVAAWPGAGRSERPLWPWGEDRVPTGRQQSSAGRQQDSAEVGPRVSGDTQPGPSPRHLRGLLDVQSWPPS